MTVSELIQKLQAFEPEMLVMVDGYESGFDEVKEIRYIAGLSLWPSDGDKQWYDGEYQKVNALGVEKDTISAVYLPRSQ